MKKDSGFAFIVTLLFVFCWIIPVLYADDDMVTTTGQTIYVPAYSHIYSGDRERPFLLTVTLSIRNIDPTHQIKITRVDYYQTQGKYLKSYLEKPIILGSLESIRYVVPEKDETGGSGANFIVAWTSDKRVNSPIIETVMIGTQYQQGVSFTSRGRAIKIVSE